MYLKVKFTGRSSSPITAHGRFMDKTIFPGICSLSSSLAPLCQVLAYYRYVFQLSFPFNFCITCLLSLLTLTDNLYFVLLLNQDVLTMFTETATSSAHFSQFHRLLKNRLLPLLSFSRVLYISHHQGLLIDTKLSSASS